MISPAYDFDEARGMLNLHCETVLVEGLKGTWSYALEKKHSDTTREDPTITHLVEKYFNTSGAAARYSLSMNDAEGICVLHELSNTTVEQACQHEPRVEGSVNICACARFDCAAGAWNQEEGWSPEKKQWCCRNKAVGCKDRAEWERVENDLFDCKVGKGDWGEVWRLNGKKWCCDLAGAGCLDITHVSGSTARYAAGTMDIFVGQPAVLASDPEVPPLLEEGIAKLMGVHPATCQVVLEPEDKLRGHEAGLVKMRYTVSVPVDNTGNIELTEDGLSDAMTLAVTSAVGWTRTLDKAMGEKGGYIFSVAHVGEVSLTNVNPLPLRHAAGNREGEITAGVAIVTLIGVAVFAALYLAPKVAQEESARMPDLSPKKSLMAREEFFDDAISDSTASPCKPACKSEPSFGQDEWVIQQALAEEVESQEPPRTETPRSKAAQQKKCCGLCTCPCCGGDCGCGQPTCCGGPGCGPSPRMGCGGVCGGSRGVSEPPIAGPASPVAVAKARAKPHEKR